MAKIRPKETSNPFARIRSHHRSAMQVSGMISSAASPAIRTLFTRFTMLVNPSMRATFTAARSHSRTCPLARVTLTIPSARVSTDSAT